MPRKSLYILGNISKCVRLSPYVVIIYLLTRRPIAQKVQDIGVWLDIMETLGKISIITNAFIIALTSEFIPKVVYRAFYSADGTLEGYVDFSLSYFDMKHHDVDSELHESINITEPVICRYADYKTSSTAEPPYQHNSTFWHIWLARSLHRALELQTKAIRGSYNRGEGTY